MMLQLTGIDISRCPLCQKGTLVFVADLSAGQLCLRGYTQRYGTQIFCRILRSLDGWLSYDSVAISRLDAQGRQKRRTNGSARRREVELASLMRAVGEQLDIVQAHSFTIVWAYDSVAVEYQTLGRPRARRTFSVDKLRELSSRMRFRRSNRYA
jgi:hypothetical protein